MNDTPTLADVFLNFGGKTLVTTSTAFTSIGVLYGINKLTALGIGTLELMPFWIGLKQLSEEDKKKPVLDRQPLLEELWSYAKISLVIVAGVCLKVGGGRMSAPDFVRSVNDVLYR